MRPARRGYGRSHTRRGDTDLMLVSVRDSVSSDWPRLWMTDEDCLKCGAWISWGGAMPDWEEGRRHADAACSHRRGGRLRGRSVLFTSVFMPSCDACIGE